MKRKAMEKLSSTEWVLCVNGSDVGRVVFSDTGAVKGMSAFEGCQGFLLDGTGAQPYLGLYIWEDPLWKKAAHARKSRFSVVRRDDGTLELCEGDVAIATASSGRDCCPLDWCAAGLVTKSWCNWFQPFGKRFVKIHLDDSTLGMVVISPDVLASIGEEPWYDDDDQRPSRQVLLTRDASHRETRLAAKYDLWGFKDKLGFEAAKEYARSSALAAVALIGLGAVVDIGSGSIANGPFADPLLRKQLGTRWIANDVSESHFAANEGYRAAGHEDVHPIEADLTACANAVEGCHLAIAKDSLNNLRWPSLRRLVDNLRSAGVKYLLTNGEPGYDNSARRAETYFDGDAWTYYVFDPAGADLELSTVALFLPNKERQHLGTWGLYAL